MDDEENPLAGTKKSAIAAAMCVVAGHFVSIQSVETSSEMVNGVGSVTVNQGPDFGHLALGAIAALLALVGLVKLRSLGAMLAAAGPVPDGVTSGKRLYAGVFVAVLVTSAWVIYTGLPQTSVTSVSLTPP